jgi:hypothetical protein
MRDGAWELAAPPGAHASGTPVTASRDRASRRCEDISPGAVGHRSPEGAVRGGANAVRRRANASVDAAIAHGDPDIGLSGPTKTMGGRRIDRCGDRDAARSAQEVSDGCDRDRPLHAGSPSRCAPYRRGPNRKRRALVKVTTSRRQSRAIEDVSSRNRLVEFSARKVLAGPPIVSPQRVTPGEQAGLTSLKSRRSTVRAVSA